MAAKLENVKRVWLEGKIRTYLTRVKLVKNHQSALSGAGLPDTFYQSRDLGGVHLEFKYAKGGRFNWAAEPTKLQKQTLRELWLAGANVGVIVYSEQYDVWCSVHGNDLIAAIDGERPWDFVLTWDSWACVLSRVGTKGDVARLVWGSLSC